MSGATPRTSDPDNWHGDVRWATPADLSRLDGPYIYDTPRMITDAGLQSCAARVLPEGSVLLSSRAPIGHVAINSVPMATNQGFKSLIPGPRVDAKYLYHWLRANTAHLQSMGNGATFKELSKKTVERILVPLPTIDEQRRIAAILDHADVLRAKRRQVLTRLDTLTQSIFHDMFGTEANNVALGDVCLRITDGTHQSPEWSDQGVPFLFVSNITSGEIDFETKKHISHDVWRTLTRRCPIDVGDVLYSTVGSYGFPAVVRTEDPFAFQRHIAHIKPDQDVLLPDFLSAQLSSAPLRRQAARAARGIAQPTVNLASIREFNIVVPSVARQKEFVARVAPVSEMKLQARAVANGLTALFESLQSRAFSGQL
ncbi:restriction endonuclease subunit S [Demequina sp. TMPB413]|nr:restriction endonuclease subunit S [Demequina sp. TMPB413]